MCTGAVGGRQARGRSGDGLQRRAVPTAHESECARPRHRARATTSDNDGGRTLAGTARPSGCCAGSLCFSWVAGRAHASFGTRRRRGAHRTVEVGRRRARCRRTTNMRRATRGDARRRDIEPSGVVAAVERRDERARRRAAERDCRARSWSMKGVCSPLIDHAAHGGACRGERDRRAGGRADRHADRRADKRAALGNGGR